jgi:hypothetical protein
MEQDPITLLEARTPTDSLGQLVKVLIGDLEQWDKFGQTLHGRQTWTAGSTDCSKQTSSVNQYQCLSITNGLSIEHLQRARL